MLDTHKLMVLEQKGILVESLHFPDVIYCIDKNGNGVNIVYNSKEKIFELAIAGEHLETFINELKEVYNHMKRRSV